MHLKFDLSVLLALTIWTGANGQRPFVWPNGMKAAVSLTFDDARGSQVEGGTALLDQYGVKATFFLVPAQAEKKLSGWRQAVASGHEIGNHSSNHPCTGNFEWSRHKALEDYTMAKMRKELTDASDRIEALLGVRPRVFAYPCGQKFVGRGVNTQSYVPLVAEMFVLGRGWMDEAMNDPGFCDFAQLTGIEMDGKDFAQIKTILEAAKKSNQWVVLAGHEMAATGSQTTRLSMLKELCEYARDPANGIWIAPAGVVAEYVQRQR